MKSLVAGGFGVEKRTFIGAASEIEPLSIEELITAASVGADNLGGIEQKSKATVVLDLGRITLQQHGIVLYLFGTPGQERFGSCGTSRRPVPCVTPESATPRPSC